MCSPGWMRTNIAALAVVLFACGGGSDGAPGVAGADGAPGSVGQAGPSGATGAAGPSGAAGANGSTGPSGASGDAGAPGEAGAAGEAGAQGPSGASAPGALSRADFYLVRKQCTGLAAGVVGADCEAHCSGADDVIMTGGCIWTTTPVDNVVNAPLLPDVSPPPLRLAGWICSRNVTGGAGGVTQAVAYCLRAAPAP